MKKLILLFTFFIITINQTFAATYSDIDNLYNKYYDLIKEKKDSKAQVIESLDLLDSKLTILIKQNNKYKKVYSYIKNINSEKADYLKKLNLVQEGIDNLKYDLSGLFEDIYILDDKLEYYDEFSNKYFSFKIENYVYLNNDSYNYFLQNGNEGYTVFKYNGNVLFSKDFTKTLNYTKQELFEFFTHKLDITDGYKLVLEGDYYYYYDFTNSKFFTFDTDRISLENLSKYDFEKDITLILKDEESYYFINNYDKIKLFKKSIISNISNKEQFLFAAFDDYSKYKKNLTTDLEEINNLTKNLIKNTENDEEKIKIIYTWIVENIDYYTSFSDGNKQIFSGVGTFELKKGVCDGYTKLFVYMLSFAGIKDVELIRGYAFDSTYFPDYGHAWIKIGNDYYDPTFDDPVGSTREDFLYFKIPHDILYVNRFDNDDRLSELKNLSLEKRKFLVKQKFYSLYDEYSDYNLLKTYKNIIELGFGVLEDINISNLSKKVDFSEVTMSNNSVYIIENGEKKYIEKLNYYIITDENLESLLKKYDLDLSEIKWGIFNNNGDKFYGLIYNLTTY